MCTNLIHLPNGAEVPCRVCGMCTANKVKDWVGRCKAESLVSTHSLVATLTYGMDDKYGGAENNLQAKMLNYKDVQRWLKMVRMWTNRSAEGRVLPGPNQNVVRYMAIGEYGSVKGRAHWHVIIFCKGQMVPNVRMSLPGEPKIRYMHRHQRGGPLWPFGWSQWQAFDEGTAAYALKYLTKGDFTKGEEKRVGLSIQPPLGNDYFEKVAQEHVDQGLSPTTCKYSFGERARDGHVIEYYLAGSAIYNYLNAFAQRWRAKHGNENWPHTEIMEKFEEERYRRGQFGLWNWRDEPDWLELKKLEERKGWVSDIADVAGTVVPRKVEKGVVAPFPPIEAYERR